MMTRNGRGPNIESRGMLGQKLPRAATLKKLFMLMKITQHYFHTRHQRDHPPWLSISRLAGYQNILQRSMLTFSAHVR